MPQVKTKTSSKSPAAHVAAIDVSAMSPEDYHRMVAEAAYFIAEKRGFGSDDSFQNWTEAEAQIQARINMK